MDYKEKISRAWGINLLALFKLEYGKTIDKFDVERYSKALENFHNSIDELKITPPKEFMILGVEHLHELSEEHREMLKTLIRKSEIIEAETLPEMLKHLINSFSKLNVSIDDSTEVCTPGVGKMTVGELKQQPRPNIRVKTENLSMAGEYATASEICRRNFYAQVTLGRWKRTDILVYNPETGKELRIEVKSKQGEEWPGIKGIPPTDDRTLLVFVDFQNKESNKRPDFYLLDANDWQDFLKNHVTNKPGFVKLIDNHIPVWKGKYIGTSVRPDQIAQHKEKWEKIEKLLS